MFPLRLQLIIGTLLGIGFLTIASFIIAVCFFWIIAWTLPVAWRVWSLWKAFAAYRRGESVAVSALSAISPKAALWLPRLSAVIFHLLGRPAPPNWRAQAPPSFAQAAHIAQNEGGQREGIPNTSWLRQAERDRMMATRNEGQSSNMSFDANQAPVPPPPHAPSAEAAEGGRLVEMAISAIQFVQNIAQQLMDKLSDYHPNAAHYQQGFHQRLASQPPAGAAQSSSLNAPINADQSYPNITPTPPQQPLQVPLAEGIKRRHPYPQFHADPNNPEESSQHYTTPQPSAPSR